MPGGPKRRTLEQRITDVIQTADVKLTTDLADPSKLVIIQDAAAVIQPAGDLSYMELSIAAKAYFALTRLKGKAALDEISGLMPQFGWSVSKDELEKASAFLERAHLVTQQ